MELFNLIAWGLINTGFCAAGLWSFLRDDEEDSLGLRAKAVLISGAFNFILFGGGWFLFA